MHKKDFYSKLLELGIAETRIPSIIQGLDKLHSSLSSLDDENLEKLKNIGSLDKLFDLYISLTFSKPISIRRLQLYRKR
jgi:hypothetical protein